MRFVRFPDAAQFLEVVKDPLIQAEAKNQVLLGVSLRLARHPERTPPDMLFGAIVRGGRPIAAVMHTPPFPLHFSLFVPASESRTCLVHLIAWLRGQGRTFPSFLAEAATADLFADLWRATETQADAPQPLVDMRQRIHTLDHIPDPPRAPGRFRPADPADPADRDLAIQWARAFQREALPNEADRNVDVETGHRLDDGHLFFWERDRPVAMICKSRPGVTCCAVTLVYTPPEERGKGWGTAVTRALSRKLFEEGWQRCVLFTDLANPTSNRIYAAIGYRPVCDMTSYRFVSGEIEEG
ncbi:GNAT family N-acetyltransferase [Sulfidibacter corallicola]|uniref:GNAT family N-acetyltransferase n=1 Tax=Sulfidibacter corallicola TaxID=2818388 RepID=A0A8A4TIF9_SULCO|nr:GNAT family N-acetyltransferase [Sulfidibacter corallicola]QTD48942.1 GNAT family N-acetyltransferase [Sulfidibacter corallicola]